METFQKLLYEEELIGYTNYLKQVRFDNKLSALSKKYKGKRILIYGNGVLFNAICSNYDLRQYLDVCAISDLRYEKNPKEEYLGFKTIKPSCIKMTDAEVILVTTVNPTEIKNFLIKNNFVNKGTKIEPFLQKLLFDKVEIIKNKLHSAINYFHKTKNIVNSIKFFIFLSATEYNTKNNYLNVIQKLRNNKNKKIRVAFICEENPKWGYQSIYDAMKNDDNFEILPIINYPIITYRRQEFLQGKNISFFKSLGIDSLDGFDYKKNQYKHIEDFKPDIVFYQQPWYIKHFERPEFVSKYALTCIISYGFTSIDTQSWGSEDIRKLSGNMWKMFAESDYHNKFYQKAAQLKHKDILLTKGYPKLDFYKTPIEKKYERLWKDEGKEVTHRIIWAPHHSIEKYGFEMSNFKEQYLYFLNLAKNHLEYNFIVKPHPSLRYKCISEKFMTAEEYDAYIDEWNSLDNASVYTDGNYFDIFKTSDVLITDSSSFLAEYFYSGKPIIFFKSANRAGFNEFGLKLINGFYIPAKKEETEDLLHKLLIEKRDPLKNLREQIIQKEFYYPKNGVGQEIVKYLKKELGR